LAGLEGQHTLTYLEVVAVQEVLQRLSRIAAFTCELRIAASRAFTLLWRYRAKLPPDLLWRATIIESYVPVVTTLDPGDTFLPPGVEWDPLNIWTDVEDE